MIIIADSGSTKTTWIDVYSGDKVVTEGLNPHFTDDDHILAACNTIRNHYSSSDHFSLFFYGAGCGNAFQRQRMERLLSEGLCTNDITVGTDMLGACHAVSGQKESIVAILGTGSNACLFDGTNIRCQPTSTGFILGDNGSANHAGRILLNDYLTQRMPEEVRRKFYNHFPMSDDRLIDAVYHRPNPNRFLASLAPFATGNQEDDYCREVIYKVLNEWYHGPLSTLMQQSGYLEGEINIVGGFAKAIEQNIRDFLAKGSLRVGTIVADPISGLLEFHRSKYKNS